MLLIGLHLFSKLGIDPSGSPIVTEILKYGSDLPPMSAAFSPSPRTTVSRTGTGVLATLSAPEGAGDALWGSCPARLLCEACDGMGYGCACCACCAWEAWWGAACA